MHADHPVPVNTATHRGAGISAPVRGPAPFWRNLVPRPVLDRLRKLKRWGQRRLFDAGVGGVEAEHVAKALNRHGLNVARSSDFYSPLPVVARLAEHQSRWSKPSELVGLRYDLEAMQRRVRRLVTNYAGEYHALGPYREHQAQGYGPGFTVVDSMMLYFMIRDLKPKRYIEIGSGVSTHYSALARDRNAAESAPLQITCIDPFPYHGLGGIRDIQLIQNEVQDVAPSFFAQLEAGDVLFIDSTHVVKLDGDVPYLYLEVVPRLEKGVVVHIHDAHFPYNIPFPAQYYVLREGWPWPVFWTEAMLVQAFLSFNNAFEITMSLPLLRFFREDFLRSALPGYTPVDPVDTRTHFGSLWIERVP